MQGVCWQMVDSPFLAVIQPVEFRLCRALDIICLFTYLNFPIRDILQQKKIAEILIYNFTFSIVSIQNHKN